jgi:hypothetical protein
VILLAGWLPTSELYDDENIVAFELTYGGALLSAQSKNARKNAHDIRRDFHTQLKTRWRRLSGGMSRMADARR